jgi:hypothetical protein
VVTLQTIAGVYVSPGPHHYRLRGLPFGWSRVVPLAEEATAHQRRVPRPRETPRSWGRWRELRPAAGAEPPGMKHHLACLTGPVISYPPAHSPGGRSQLGEQAVNRPCGMS